MLGFGLTLLGGCVATTETGQPSELYFPAHSIHIEENVGLISHETPHAATLASMAAVAHQGVYIEENVVKTGTRSSGASWGIVGVDERPPSGGTLSLYHNSLHLTLTSKNSNLSTAHATNLCITRASREWTGIGNQPSLYTSGQELVSPRFILRVGGGQYSVTDSFSGNEKTTRGAIEDVAFGELGTNVIIIGTHGQITSDFVVSSYENAELGVKQLTLPMRALPVDFVESAMAFFEFQFQFLAEI